MTKRYYIFYLIIILLYLIQSNPVYQIALFGFKPNLALYFLIALFFYSQKHIYGPLILTTIIFELSSLYSPGYFVLIYGAIFVALHYLNKKLPELNWLTIILAISVYNLIQIITIKYGLDYNWSDVLDFIIRISLPDIAFGTIVSLVAVWIITSLFTRSSYKIMLKK